MERQGGADSRREGRPGRARTPAHCPPGGCSGSGHRGRGRRRRGAGGGRAGAGRWALGSGRRCARAGAGRVRPPRAAGRAAFLMCHQHVEPGRTVPAGRTPLSPRCAPDLRGVSRPCSSCHRVGFIPFAEVIPKSRAGRARPRALGNWLGALGASRTSGRGVLVLGEAPRDTSGKTRARPCSERRLWLGRAPAPRPAKPSAGNRGGAELGLASAAWECDQVFLRVSGSHSSGRRLSPRLPPRRSTVPRDGARPVTLRGLGLEPAA